MRRTLAIIFCLTLVIGTAWAQEKSLNDYYSEVYLGEKEQGLYAGPLAPASRFDASRGESLLLDKLFYDQYAQPLILTELFELTDYWFHDVLEVASCPNYYLNQNLSYIRYLFRLQTMSYLLESMKQTHLKLHGLGLDRNQCSLSWHQIFSDCKPTHEDMQKFVQRARFRYLKDLSQSDYVRMTPAEVKNWQKHVRDGKPEDLAQVRLLAWCEQQGIDCAKLRPEELGEALVASCDFDRQMIQRICSEKDQLFGMSSVPEALELIGSSNVMGLLNDGGHGKNCLRRYVEIFKKREERHSYLAKIFPKVLTHLTEVKAPYAQGSLFIPGALKEFDLKGLENFLFVEAPKPPERPPEEPVQEEPEPVVVVVEEPEPVVVEEPPPVVVIPEPLPEPEKKSAFARAHEKLLKEEQAKVIVNMEEFKKDFIFTDKMIQSLTEPLKDYQTREALQDMLKYDLLGTKVEPFRLIFLKFLIDNQMHQGLFNIISVIGHQFYVLNDIDGDSRAVAVEIANNEETRFRWQITLLQDSQVKNNKILETAAE